MNAQEIKLPAPNRTGGKPLMESLSQRKSTRSFSDKELSSQQLSNLLWAANGFNRDDKRTAPTANNRQELELYVVLKDGIYFYNAKEHRLTLVNKGDFRKNAGMQEFVADAPLNILFVSDSGVKFILTQSVDLFRKISIYIVHQKVWVLLLEALSIKKYYMIY